MNTFQIKRPMLAYSKSVGHCLNSLTYPLYASPKYDGIRGITKDGQLVSRTLTLLPNKHIQRVIKSLCLPNNMEGELITYDKDGKMEPYNTVQGKVMSREGEPRFNLAIFDWYQPSKTFAERFLALNVWLAEHKPDNVYSVWQSLCSNKNQVIHQESIALTTGFEGLMLRSPTAFYKFGRSTFKEQGLLKLKRFEDSEAKIVGMKELMHNLNEEDTDARGYAKRSSHLSSQYGGAKMGCLVVEDPKHPEWGTFEIGSGFTDEQRKEFWGHKDFYTLHRKLIKYKYQSHGMKDKPRSPIFLGFRSKEDL